ncbi:MAG: B12-binding domain-containing radical SAM protein, partial [Candidatus Woesebacteria bacterium]|nr:B12-binding domain-containing radical SAM protein [Candidatus Woesebacteria bacterium]
VDVQQRISRKQDNDKTDANLRWLLGQSNANVHTDLLFGLPGESLESFAKGFDRLYALGPQEIQLGILKRLRGTPIIRHAAEYRMVFDSAPPYALKESGTVDTSTMQRVSRFARYWELVANSGRFRKTLPLLLAERLPAGGTGAGPGATGSPFHAFMGFSDWLWQRTEKTSGFSPEFLVDALFDYLCGRCALPSSKLKQVLLEDYLASGARGSPPSLRELLPKRDPPRQKQRVLNAAIAGKA